VRQQRESASLAPPSAGKKAPAARGGGTRNEGGRAAPKQKRSHPAPPSLSHCARLGGRGAVLLLCLRGRGCRGSRRALCLFCALGGPKVSLLARSRARRIFFAGGAGRRSALGRALLFGWCPYFFVFGCIDCCRKGWVGRVVCFWLGQRGKGRGRSIDREKERPPTKKPARQNREKKKTPRTHTPPRPRSSSRRRLNPPSKKKEGEQKRSASSGHARKNEGKKRRRRPQIKPPSKKGEPVESGAQYSSPSSSPGPSALSAPTSS
jgi:hypothetical protein